jgi:hypothetical protein
MDRLQGIQAPVDDLQFTNWKPTEEVEIWLVESEGIVQNQPVGVTLFPSSLLIGPVSFAPSSGSS